MLKYHYSSQPTSFKKKLSQFLKKFPKYRSSVLKLPFTHLPWQNLKTLEKLNTKKTFKNIAVVGIGGSSLGAKALAKALNTKKIIILDNVDPDFVTTTLSSLNLKKTLFILISKSGETIEILSLASILFQKLKAAKNFLLITDNQKSTLGQWAKKHKIPIFQSPTQIPGRFSVLSIVGLLPPALAGAPVGDILKSACRTSWLAAYNLACYQYLHYKNKKNICVVFAYSEALQNFVDWYIQLLSESIGKSKKIGITPVKAIGVKDQHSQLQLFLDGPDDKFYIFIKPEKCERDIKIHGKNYTLHQLFNNEYEGVKKAFEKESKPFLEITFPFISPKVLGELFFFFELEIAFLGSLLKVNIENQPAVEESKKITSSLLGPVHI